MSAAEALAPEQSVDEVRESLSVTEKGQPANTIGNCRTVFCHDPRCSAMTLSCVGRSA